MQQVNEILCIHVTFDFVPAKLIYKSAMQCYINKCI